MSLNQKKYIDFIDLKQQFVDFDFLLPRKKGHIYEFNFGTTSTVSLYEEKISDYLDLFSSIKDQNLFDHYAVHFTSIIPKDKDQDPLNYFKLNLGFNTRASLTNTEKMIGNVHRDFFKDDLVKLKSKRIVINKSNLTFEENFKHLDDYLVDNHPLLLKNYRVFS